MKVLVVDDEQIMRVSVANALADAGHETANAGTAAEALEALRSESYDAAVVDLKMPGMDGLELLQIARGECPGLAVVMMTAYGTVETAVTAMKQGAYDYLTKPFDTDELLLVLDRLEERQQMLSENRRLQDALQERYGFHRMVGRSAAMQKVYEALDIVCARDCTVLVTGETGTGKEMVAQAIHYNSHRRAAPLVAVSCASLSAEILESELFGHVRGAFTGAVTDSKGRFEVAAGGTLFLDEVDDIPVALQVKLLRVLEESQFERVGSATPIPADVRIVAAAKTDLRQHVAAGRFRDDLYYRLNQVPIHLPPLRQRREDIPLLIEHFLKELDTTSEISPAAHRALLEYGWRGNVRELRHMIERLVLFHPERIDVGDLPEEVFSDASPTEASLPEGSYDQIMAVTEKRLLQNAMARAHGNQREAARLLRMPPSSLRSRLERHELL